jgi:hypothetical protein
MASRSISCSVDGALELLGAAVRDVLAVLRDAAPGSISGDEAKAFVDLFAQVERAAASGIALYAPRVLETGAHAKAGHGTAAQWLASVAGSSDSVAKGRLAAAKAAGADEALTEALRAGGLSCAELTVLGAAEAAAPGSAGTLLGLAGAGASHQELRDTASVLRAAAKSKESERARRARVHARRHVRWRQCPQGGISGEFFCDEVAWAKVAPALEAAAKERWKAAGSKDPTTLEAHRLDVFIDTLAGSGAAVRAGGRSKRASRVETLVLIDAGALRRGTTQGQETCEIEGIGPVSVAAATELLGEGALRYIVKEGFDVTTVTRSTRVIANCIEAALVVRDRTCCVPGCGKRLGLERDHAFVDYGDAGATELANLARLCPEHHALKTFGGWRLDGRPGNFTWVAPAHPKSAGAISRARKVAAAKGTAKREAGVTALEMRDRNRLRRT